MTRSRIGGARLPLYALFAANAVSLTGNVLAMVAIPWFVLETSGSALRTGITGAVAAAPMIVAGIFGGTLVDRLGYRRASVIADVASCLAVLLVPLLYHLDALSFPLLLALVFLGGLLDAPGTTARAALLPDLADAAGMRRERANAIEQAISRFAFLLGPPLAGVLIAALGTTSALWLDAATFVVSAALVQRFVPVPGRVVAEVAASGGYLDDMRAAFAFLRGDTLMLLIAMQVGITNFLDAANSTMWPVYAEREFGRALDLGLILAASATGAVATTVAFAIVGHRLPRRRTYIAAFVLTSLPLVVPALYPGLALVLLASLVRGIGAGPLNPILTTIEQERIPPAMRGRVFGLLMALAWLSVPLGRLAAGASIELAGLTATILAIAACYVAITVSMFFWPALHEMDQPSARAGRTRPAYALARARRR